MCVGGGGGVRGGGRGAEHVRAEKEQFPLGLSLQMVPLPFPIFYIQKLLRWYRSQQNPLAGHAGNGRGQMNHWERLPELQTQGLPPGDTSYSSLTWIRARSSTQIQGPLASPTPEKGHFL